MLKVITGIIFFVLSVSWASAATITDEHIEAEALQYTFQQCIWKKCQAGCNKGADTVCMENCGKKFKNECKKEAKEEANP